MSRRKKSIRKVTGRGKAHMMVKARELLDMPFVYEGKTYDEVHVIVQQHRFILTLRDSARVHFAIGTEKHYNSFDLYKPIDAAGCERIAENLINSVRENRASTFDLRDHRYVGCLI